MMKLSSLLINYILLFVFYSCCLFVEIEKNSLLLDVKTRWDSLFLMIERFLQQYPALQAASLDPRLRKPMERDRYTWDGINDSTGLMIKLRIIWLTSVVWIKWLFLDSIAIHNFSFDLLTWLFCFPFFPKQTLQTDRWGLQKGRGIYWTHGDPVHINPLCLNWKELHLRPSSTNLAKAEEPFHSPRWRFRVCLLSKEENLDWSVKAISGKNVTETNSWCIFYYSN